MSGCASMADASLSGLVWEEVVCHLCGARNGDPIHLRGTPLTIGQFGYEIHPVLCRCGLVFLNPRWSGPTYAKFYTGQYDDLYRLETKPDYGIEGVRRNMAEVWARVTTNLPSARRIKTILDAGCGSGYGLQYLKEQVPQAVICGIEASLECCRTLQEEVGAELLDKDLEGAWLAKNQGRFDLIVTRHVVEHFLTPVSMLEQLRSTLAPGGSIYIAVPDMMHPRTVLRDYDKWWEYWFRAVHPYYYCRETLFATLSLAGLIPLAWGEEKEEVWCLAAAGEQSFKLSSNLQARQLQLLRQLLP